MNPVVSHQVRSHIILSRERVRRAERNLGSGSPERLHQIGGLGGHMEAGRKPDTLEWLLLGKSPPNLSEHRHGPLGPFSSTLTLVGQSQVFDVVLGKCSRDVLNGHGLL